MNPTLLLAIPLLPLVAALIAGLGGRCIGRAGAHARYHRRRRRLAAVLSLQVLQRDLLAGRAGCTTLRSTPGW